jgi:hypothetical protein
VEACVGGTPQECIPRDPSQEVCDGVDNDCDGEVDEGLGTLTCGVGVCITTVDVCIDSIRQECIPGVPTEEICDGVDNNCNGLVDEGGVCSLVVPFTVEAENMTFESPMEKASDPVASGGHYINPTSGTDSMGPVQEAFKSISILEEGTYYLWARMYGFDSNSDALYVGIDSSWDRIYPDVTGDYRWVRVETSDGSGEYGFNLSAGEHILQLGHGEVHARLDSFFITDDPGAVPPFPLCIPVDEVCDGIDNDCDELVDEGYLGSSPYHEYDAISPDFNDLNDFMETAENVGTLCSQPFTIEGVIDPNRDEDNYRFFIEKDSFLSLETIPGDIMSDNVDTYLEIFNSMGETLGSDDNNGAEYTYSFINELFLVEGEYIVSVSHAAEVGTGSYRLVMTPVLIDWLAAADTCSEADFLPDLPAGEYLVDMESATNSININANNTSCTGYSSYGHEVILPLTLAGGEKVEITFTADDGDSSIYLLRSCIDVESCVAGSDAIGNFVPEIITYENLSDTPETLYLVLDGYSGIPAYGTLIVNITSM